MVQCDYCTQNITERVRLALKWSEVLEKDGTSSLYRQQYIVASVSSDKCNYCLCGSKRLLINAPNVNV